MRSGPLSHHFQMKEAVVGNSQQKAIDNAVETSDAEELNTSSSDQHDASGSGRGCIADFFAGLGHHSKLGDNVFEYTAQLIHHELQMSKLNPDFISPGDDAHVPLKVPECRGPGVYAVKIK